MRAKPTDAAKLERAASLMNEGLFAVSLQRRRLRTAELEDDVFVFRQWADWQFLIVALTRLRRAALIATHVDPVKTEISEAIARFDAVLPALRTMRNVAEHIDEYAIESGRRHHRAITRHGLQVGSFDDRHIEWRLNGSLAFVLDADGACQAAEDLLMTVRRARDTFVSSKAPT